MTSLRLLHFDDFKGLVKELLASKDLLYSSGIYKLSSRSNTPLSSQEAPGEQRWDRDGARDMTKRRVRRREEMVGVYCR
eukprot:762486-Hanusia_phi.AAC.3